MGKGGELIIQYFPSLEVGANRLLCVSSSHSIKNIFSQSEQMQCMRFMTKCVLFVDWLDLWVSDRGYSHQFQDALLGLEINLLYATLDRLQVISTHQSVWPIGSVEICLSWHFPLWYGYGGGLKCLERLPYFNKTVYPLMSLPLVAYCTLPADWIHHSHVMFLQLTLSFSTYNPETDRPGHLCSFINHEMLYFMSSFSHCIHKYWILSLNLGLFCCTFDMNLTQCLSFLLHIWSLLLVCWLVWCFLFMQITNLESLWFISLFISIFATGILEMQWSGLGRWMVEKWAVLGYWRCFCSPFCSVSRSIEGPCWYWHKFHSHPSAQKRRVLMSIMHPSGHPVWFPHLHSWSSISWCCYWHLRCCQQWTPTIAWGKNLWKIMVQFYSLVSSLYTNFCYYPWVQ
jgi:hypothetical protein